MISSVNRLLFVILFLFILIIAIELVIIKINSDKQTIINISPTPTNSVTQEKTTYPLTPEQVFNNFENKEMMFEQAKALYKKRGGKIIYIRIELKGTLTDMRIPQTKADSLYLEITDEQQRKKQITFDSSVQNKIIVGQLKEPYTVTPLILSDLKKGDEIAIQEQYNPKAESSIKALNAIFIFKTLSN